MTLNIRSMSNVGTCIILFKNFILGIISIDVSVKVESKAIATNTSWAHLSK